MKKFVSHIIRLSEKNRKYENDSRELVFFIRLYDGARMKVLNIGLDLHG